MIYEVFIGIDISKKTVDVALHKAGVHQEFNSTQSGFKEMISWIKKHTSISKEKWLVCMEHSGFYGLPAKCYFNKLGIDVCLEHPYQIKHSMGLQRNKTDKADAKIIARYAYLHREELKPTITADNVILKLQSLLAYRDRLVNTRKGFTNALKTIEGYTDKIVHGFVQKETESMKKQLNVRIKKVEKEIMDLIKKEESDHENYNLATSVKGIGTIIAAYMLVYTQNFTSITESRKFACYSGIAPFEKSSGSSLYIKPKVSPMANKKMKALINMGAWMALQRDKELKEYYNRKVEQGKHPLCAINAVRNKLIGRVFAVVKRRTPFVVLDTYKN
jgi:transposase